MKILSKSDIIQRFSIGKDIYTNSKLDGSGFTVNNNEYNTNGVIFIGHWAYYTNNQFILRCPAHDRPCYDANLEYEYNKENEDPIKQLDTLELLANKQGRGQTLLFYNYENNTSEDRGDNELSRYWMNNFEQCFLGFRANKVIFKKNELLAHLDDIFGKKVNDRAVSAVVMVADYEEQLLRCKVVRFKKRDESKEIEFSIPIYIDPFINWHSTPSFQPMIAVNALYLNLLQVFQENEFINMSFNYVPANPKERTKFLNEHGFTTLPRVVFTGHGGDDHPEIKLGLTQIYPNFNPFE